MRGFVHDSQVLKLVSVVMMALIGSTNASCGHENGRACCLHERVFCNRWKKAWGKKVCTGWGTRGACDDGLMETPGCRGSCGGCSFTMCKNSQRAQDDFFDDVKGEVDNGITKIEKLNTDISKLSFPSIINEFENWAKTNIMDPIEQATQAISNTISEAEGKLSEIETGVNRLAQEVEQVIEDGVDAAKSTAINTAADVGNLLSDAAMKVKSKAEEVWKDAIDADPILIACLRGLSTEVATSLDKAGDFGDLVQKALSEMLSPHKCRVCADKLTPQQRAECGCSDTDRRLSGSLWYAIDKYGPGNNLEREEEPPVNDTTVSVKTHTFSSEQRQLNPQPVTNDLAQCPSAPEKSHEPGYSDTSHFFYSTLLALHRTPIFPDTVYIDDSKNCANTILSPITKPNPKNNDKWDSRTNQNVVAAIQILEITLNKLMRDHESTCETIPDKICALYCVSNPVASICWLTAAVGTAIQQLFQGIYRGIELHDGVVDGAEIEATLKNSEKLIKWTCTFESMITEKAQRVRTLGSSQEQISASDKLTDNNINNIMDEIVAPFQNEEVENILNTADEALMAKFAVINTDIANRFRALNEEVDETFDMLHMLLLTDPSQRPGYGQSEYVCSSSTCPSLQLEGKLSDNATKDITNDLLGLLNPDSKFNDVLLSIATKQAEIDKLLKMLNNEN